MKSPFPGMDPYLEQFWGDVHTTMAVYLRDQLQPQMPQGLVVRIEEYTSVAEEDEKVRKVTVPDIHVLEKTQRGAKRPAKGAAVAQPYIVPLKGEPLTLRSVRVLDTTLGKRVVTAIEILSPANKTSRAGRRQYEQRRTKLLIDPTVNLVEIDLVRKGDPILLVPDDAMPYEYYYPYRISVLRSHGERRVEMYKASFRDRLPVIPVPLRAKDADARLNMQALVDRCYVAGPGDLIDYTQQLRPPLYGPDADWVEALLRKKGLR